MGAHLHKDAVEGAAADGMTFLRQTVDDVRAEGRLVVMRAVSTAMAGLPLVTPFHLLRWVRLPGVTRR